MNITCNECGKSYDIDENEIPGTAARVSCKICGQLIYINKPAAAKKPNPKPDVFKAPESDTNHSLFQTLKSDRNNPTNDALPPTDPSSIPGFSIRSKITLIIALLVSSSLLLAGLYAGWKSAQALSGQMVARLDTTAKQKTTVYSLLFDRIQKEAVAVADYANMTYARTDITTDMRTRVLMPWNGTAYKLDKIPADISREIRNLERIRLVLQTITSNNPNLILGYMGTASGLTVFNDESAVDDIIERNAYIVTEQEWYIQAQKAGKAIWTQPYIDNNAGKLVVTCAAPVYNLDDSLAGVIGFDVLLETIQQDILRFNIGYDSYAFLIDNDGNTLVHPGMTQKDARWDDTYTSDNLSQSGNPKFNAILSKMIQGQSGTDTYASGESGETFIAYAPLKEINASLGICVSRDKVIQPARELQREMMLFAAVTLLVSLLIGINLGNNIVKPLNRLTAVANQMRQGQMELEVMGEERKDEIGILTQSINRLIINLKVALDK